MGEEKFEQTALVKAVQGVIAEQPLMPSGDLRVATPGGVFQVRWDENASASTLGQLAFFGEFLEVSGLHDPQSSAIDKFAQGLESFGTEYWQKRHRRAAVQRPSPVGQENCIDGRSVT